MNEVLELINRINSVIEFLRYELKYAKKHISEGFPPSYSAEDIARYNAQIEDTEKAIYHLLNIVVYLRDTIDTYLDNTSK